MTVPAKPFWLSAADAEFNGNNWLTNILSLAGIPAPRLAGDLAGKSAWSIVTRPPNDTLGVAPNYAYVHFKAGSGNTYWYNNQAPFGNTLTKGAATIRLTNLGGSATPIFVGCSNGVTFTPDGTNRGVQLVAPGNNYHYCTIRVEVFNNGVLQATWNDVYIEASSA